MIRKLDVSLLDQYISLAQWLINEVVVLLNLLLALITGLILLIADII